MARKTGVRKSTRRTTGGVKARFTRAKRTTPEVVPTTIFWPDRIDHVKAIAMRGMTDDEMAVVMGVSAELLASWKAYYPAMSKAIEEGRMVSDAEVVAALHRNAVGYSKTTDEVVRTRRGAQVVQVDKYFPAETAAQKYWLQNRAPSHWNGAQRVSLSTPKGEAVRVENKSDIINSLLNMIRPQPDNAS